MTPRIVSSPVSHGTRAPANWREEGVVHHSGGEEETEEEWHINVEGSR